MASERGVTGTITRFLCGALLALCALSTGAQTFGGGSLGGGNEADFLPVTEAYRLSADITGEGNIQLDWQIADAYYLYQHRFDFELSDASGTIDLNYTLPEGLEKEDDYFGQVVVYYQHAGVNLAPARSAGQAKLRVTSQGCADAGLCYPPHKQYFDVNFTSGSITETGPPPKPASTAPKATVEPRAAAEQDADTGSLWYMLLLAFAGGTILNLMPCVFPILSLKVLSFARSTDQDRHLQSWVYTAGVIVSFVLVAAVLIGLQQAGSAIGWGFQLQSPGFVIALAYLFIAMGLSLSGLIEFGGGMMNAGSGLANRGGTSGSFFTGVLAVIVASPCTAPFMGTALGFAVSQPPLIGLLVFAALGAGMAAPLLLFSYSGAARAMMPKPGPWMETLKQFLAFPLYATALWLFWVAGRQTGINTMSAALAGALMLALGLWLWDQRRWRQIATVACLGAAVALGAVRGLDGDPASGADYADGKVRWSERNVAALREQGQAVFVDVTADWCITCKANEAAVLFTEDIERAFDDSGVVYMIADWTNHNAEIAALLELHGRTGIPLYLMYPADPAAQPLILPQILTKSLVMDALQAVSPKNTEIASTF
ncbi:MAG: protein-disulfide reductase DsbD [Halioglobus sp.]|nr:protein-disulfide reductase DsbD [Halioglobus sp.]